MKTIYLIAFLSICILLNACNKEAGEGGLGVVKGQIIEDKYNSNGTILSSFPAAEKDVYIIYGDEDNIFDDKTETSFDGTFQFEFLNKGTYQIFTYEECITCPSGDTIVKLNATIDKRKDVIDLGKINIKN